jgi:arsenate reductase
MTWREDVEQIRALKPRHILFLCVQNSARSQLAEGIARNLAPDEVRVSSAGSLPASVRSEALHALYEIGIDAGKQVSKSISDIDASSVDVVITLCAEEVCPVFPHPVAKFHWPLPDPAGKGIEAFRKTRNELQTRLRELFA